MLAPCERCGEPLRSAAGRAAHLELHRLRDRPYTCHECDKAFARCTDLTRHAVLMLHTGERSLRCGLCRHRYRTAGELQRHLQRSHALGLKPELQQPLQLQPQLQQPLQLQPQHQQPLQLQPQQHQQPPQLQPQHPKPRQPQHQQPQHLKPLQLQPQHLKPLQLQPQHLQPLQLQPLQLQRLRGVKRHKGRTIKTRGGRMRRPAAREDWRQDEKAYRQQGGNKLEEENNKEEDGQSDEGEPEEKEEEEEEEEDTLSCHLCERKYQGSSSLLKHLRTEHRNSATQQEEMKQGVTVEEKQGVAVEKKQEEKQAVAVEKNQEEKQAVTEAPKALRAGRRSHTFLRRSVPDANKPHECSQCGEKFRYQWSLTKHSEACVV